MSITNLYAVYKRFAGEDSQALIMWGLSDFRNAMMFIKAQRTFEGFRLCMLFFAFGQKGG